MYNLMTEKTERFFRGFMLVLLCVVFLLNHSNQSSSQSLATLLLILGPGLILLPKSPLPLPLSIRWFIASSVAIFAYSLFIFFHHPSTEVAASSMRSITFYLLAPIAIYALWQKPPSKRFIFWLVFFATVFSLYPVIKEYFGHGQRGNSSVHPIFWGNVALTSGTLIFVLSRDKTLTQVGKYWLGLLGLIMGLTASFWSQTRGGWISIPIVLIALTLFRVVKVREFILTIVVLVAVFSSSDMLQQRLTSTFKASGDRVQLDASTQFRLDMWHVSIQAFEESYLIGNGLDGFSKKITELKNKNQINFYFEHAHNEVMEVLASRGVIGLLLLLLLILGLLITYWRNRKNTYAIAGMISTGQFLIYSTSEIFFSAKFTITYFLILQSFLLITCYTHNVNQDRASGGKLGIS